MIGIKLAAITGVASLLIGGGIGWQARDWKADSDALDAQNAAIAAANQAAVDNFAAGEQYEAYRNAADGVSYETRTIIEREYRNVQVPAQCALPDAVADSLQRSIDTANGDAPSEPNSTMREAARPTKTGD